MLGGGGRPLLRSQRRRASGGAWSPRQVVHGRHSCPVAVGFRAGAASMRVQRAATAAAADEAADRRRPCRDKKRRRSITKPVLIVQVKRPCEHTASQWDTHAAAPPPPVVHPPVRRPSLMAHPPRPPLCAPASSSPPLVTRGRRPAQHAVFSPSAYAQFGHRWVWLLRQLHPQAGTNTQQQPMMRQSAQLGTVHGSTLTRDVTGAPQPGHVTDSGVAVHTAGSGRTDGGGASSDEGGAKPLSPSIALVIVGVVGGGGDG